MEFYVLQEQVRVKGIDVMQNKGVCVDPGTAADWCEFDRRKRTAQRWRLPPEGNQTGISDQQIVADLPRREPGRFPPSRPEPEPPAAA